MAALQPIFRKAYISLVVFGAVYIAFLLSLTSFWVQKTALYANAFHIPMWVKDVKEPENFGFARRQVTPFNVTTADGETLFAWHILPLGAYAAHEEQLVNEPMGVRVDLRETIGFEALKDDPEARVLINFHGNAGHLADGHRVQIYRSLTNMSPKIHVITFDYRGFGYSSGSPSEAGLIADGITMVAYVLSLGIPPSRIILIGQSLGTAVTSGVALHFADRAASLRLLPQVQDSSLTSIFTNAPSVVGPDRSQPIDFAAVVLVASFPSLPKLLVTYRMSGIFPVLSPLRIYPQIQEWILRFVKEDWSTSLRLSALVTAAAQSSSRKLRLHLIHALDDADIPWRNGEMNYEAAYHALASEAGDSKISIGGVDWGREGFKREARLGERVKVIFETLKFGGHNQVVASSPVALAVLKAFGLAGGSGSDFS